MDYTTKDSGSGEADSLSTPPKDLVNTGCKIRYSGRDLIWFGLVWASNMWAAFLRFWYCLLKTDWYPPSPQVKNWIFTYTRVNRDLYFSPHSNPLKMDQRHLVQNLNVWNLPEENTSDPSICMRFWKKKKNPCISGSNKTWHKGLHEIKKLYKVKKSLQIANNTSGRGISRIYKKKKTKKN